MDIEKILKKDLFVEELKKSGIKDPETIASEWEKIETTFYLLLVTKVLQIIEKQDPAILSGKTPEERVELAKKYVTDGKLGTAFANVIKEAADASYVHYAKSLD